MTVVEKQNKQTIEKLNFIWFSQGDNASKTFSNFIHINRFNVEVKAASTWEGSVFKFCPEI